MQGHRSGLARPPRRRRSGPASQELTTATASISNHEIGSSETGDADGRAGRGRHPEIAHADVGALLELVEVGDKGVGLSGRSPPMTRRSRNTRASGCLSTGRRRRTTAASRWRGWGSGRARRRVWSRRSPPMTPASPLSRLFGRWNGDWWMVTDGFSPGIWISPAVGQAGQPGGIGGR
jgi:hypothetical protein